MKILSAALLYLLTSCQILTTPEAITLEEDLAVDIVDTTAQEIVSHETANK